MTIGQALLQAAGQLSQSGILLGARTEAERLLCHVLGCKRHELFIRSNEQLSAGALSEFLDCARRRALREPLQYIIGKEEFRGLEFKVTRDTLIPRPETELLVEQAVLLAQTMEIADGYDGIFIDLCTGSGCIAVCLAKEIPSSVVYAADISKGALETARENAKRHGVADRVIFVEGDLFAPLLPFDLYGKASFILSNPPYVAKADFENLLPEIKDYEPAGALLAGQDGLEFYRRIIPGSLDYLKQGGYLIMEVGYGQAKDLLKLIEENGRFSEMEFIKDHQGIDRVLRARKAAARP